jgi:hypothetical protein
MLTPLLCRIWWAERPLDPTRRMPPESGHSSPRGRGAHPPCAGATPPAHPPEPHSKPASRPPGLSVIPPFPAGICAVSHLPSPHSTGPRPPASKGASNGRRTGNPTWPSIGNGASDLRGESAEPGLQRGSTRTAMRVPVPGSLSTSSSASRARHLAHALQVHAGERFGVGTRRPLRSTHQGNRRDLRVSCLGALRAGVQGPSTSPTAQQPEHLYGVPGASDIRISDDEQGWRLDRPDVFRKPVLDLPT